MKKVLCSLLLTLAVCSCGNHRRTVAAVPLMLGVPEDQVEKYIAGYVSEALGMPLEEGQWRMEQLFDRIVAEQKKDSSKFAYIKLTELVSKYLYDPNSPLRDEDLYLPFVRSMAVSPLTSDDIRPAYEYESEVCALNSRESVAADFLFRTAGGREMRLHDIKADYTLLFFSNPGCQACGEIVDMLEGDDFVTEMISDGSLAVVNIYIDKELDLWREYVSSYPKSWYCGYDPGYVIREEMLYNVRAIPSVYLLAADKTVILKDADPGRLLNVLYNTEAI